ncbi:hypothetical protein I6M33_16525 [Shewanella algae]|nr:hypothetical protein [Shewanella algae]
MRLFFLLLLTPLFISAEPNQTIQIQLLEMAKLDQLVREEVGNAGWDKAPKELLDKLAATDHENTQKLKSMLNKRNWFAKSEIGEDGIDAAFLIIQHSPDIEFQEKMLPLLKQSFLNGDGITGQKVALLADRVHLSKGQKQIYGTQADVISGNVIFKPILDAETVDKRRAEMKLPPLDFYKKLLEEMYGIKDHPEIDLN